VARVGSTLVSLAPEVMVGRAVLQETRLRNSLLAKKNGIYSKGVLVQREIGELAHPVSDYSANSAGPVCTAENGGGRRKGQQLKLQLVSKGDQVGWSHSSQGAFGTGR
jgi:hypothetical protein